MNEAERQLRRLQAVARVDSERHHALGHAISVVHNCTRDEQQAIVAVADSILDSWDDWDAEAGQAAQVDQDQRTYLHVMRTHIVCRIWSAIGWDMREGLTP